MATGLCVQCFTEGSRAGRHHQPAVRMGEPILGWKGTKRSLPVSTNDPVDAFGSLRLSYRIGEKAVPLQIFKDTCVSARGIHCAPHLGEQQRGLETHVSWIQVGPLGLSAQVCARCRGRGQIRLPDPSGCRRPSAWASDAQRTLLLL